jgi:hypothetical protein
MTVPEILSLTPIQFYDLHTKGFFAVKQEKHPFDDQQKCTAGSSDSSGSSSTQEQCPPSPRENDDFMGRVNMDSKNDAPPNLISSQKQDTTSFESDWIEQLDPRKTALELIKNINIRKQLQENGYQPIESDVRKSARKRKPTSFYDASPSTGSKMIRKVSPESCHDSYDSIATSNISLDETDDEDLTDSDLESDMDEKEETNRDSLHSHSKDKSTKETGASSKAKRAYTFEERFSDLQDFLRKTGHTRVPFKYPPNPSLGYWVASVRHNHKRLQNGLPLKMMLTWEQVDILSNMPGWVWCGKTVRNTV